ncbi:Fic family protein [Candidatus Woesearchaeota archaeon]|nr:Fic family protein [Candidatus Woesearchaeota archaeon]
MGWTKVLETEYQALFEIIKERNLMDHILEFNRRYLYWSELKYRLKDSSEMKYVWTFMKLLRNKRYESVPFKPIKLKYSLLPEFSGKLHHFDKFLAGNIEIQTKDLGLNKSYIVNSLMEESIASSVIEGASTTIKIAKAMLREKRKPKTKSEKMIVNNYDAMQFIVSQKNKPITPRLLLEIQARITKDTLNDPKDEGAFRDSNDIIIGDGLNPGVIAHTPPDHKDIPRSIDEFCNFANNDSEEFIHPIIKGITLHFLLGYIHPFNDGNGRTARSVFYWYMLSKGYWLFEYMAVSRRIVRSRNNYDLAYLYTEYDEMDLTYFIKYIIQCIDDSLNDLLEYIKQKQQEQAQVKHIIHEIPGLNLRQAMILEEFMKNPNKTFTIKEISETYKVVYQTARTDLLSLAEKRFINKKVSGKTFVFVFNGLNT